MGKSIKKLGVFLFILCSVFFINYKVYAKDSIENMEITVDIDSNGTGTIVQKWVVNRSDGTESYIPISNIGKTSAIKDFKVTGDGIPFDNIGSWNPKKSRQEKAGKCGIVDLGGGKYELCWGLGEYGSHEYIIEYKITEIVKNFKGTQALFWKFVNDNMSTPPKKVNLKIKTPVELNKDNAKIWSFGYKGRIDFMPDGTVVADSHSSFGKSNYLTVLLKFENPIFTLTGEENKTFDEIQKMAFKGSDYSLPKTLFERILDIFINILIFLIPVALIAYFFMRKSNKLENKDYKKGKFKGEYYREIPYDGNFADIVALLYSANLSSYKNVVSAYFLKWIKEENIEGVKTYTRGFLKDKENNNLKIKTNANYENVFEKELFDMLTDAAGDNLILESDEFKKWSKKNYTKFNKWVEDLEEKSMRICMERGYVEQAGHGGLFSGRKRVLTEKGKNLLKNCCCFYNYLYDFSLLNERDSFDVNIWDNLLVYAALFGIAERVRLEFEKLYPDYVQETSYGTDGIYIASNTASSFVSNVKKFTPSSSESSGFGGFSSSGGGGGSFGGGSGGGAR